MVMVRAKEQQAEALAHIPDDIIHLPGTGTRMGADPLLGLISAVGDASATLLGAGILVAARQLNVPWSIVRTMAFNQWKNGLIGAVPFIGDAYPFYFKSNAVNTALLLRAVKRGDHGVCPVATRSLTVRDAAGLAILILPTIALVGLVGLWFWEQNISYFSLFFPLFYRSS